MKLKVLSLNTLHGGELFEPLMEFIKKENADLLHLQEVFTNPQNIPFSEKRFSCYEYLQKELACPNMYAATTKEFEMPVEGKTLDIGTATFSKFEMSNPQIILFEGHQSFDYSFYHNRKPIDFTEGPYSALSCDINVNDTTIHSINVHGVWGFDGIDNPRRLKMRDQLKSFIDPNQPTIVAGDFNTELNTQTVQGISEGLINPFDGKLTTTFNIQRKTGGNFAHSLVDHLFVSQHFRVIDTYQPQVDISDHLPLVATLEI